MGAGPVVPWRAGHNLKIKSHRMNPLSFVAATLACGGIAFLVYSVPVVSQAMVIGLTAFVWFFYARKLLTGISGKAERQA